MTTRRRLTAALVLPALCAITTAPLRAGDGATISDGAVTFTREAYGEVPLASLTGVSSNASNDFLSSMGWWIRVSDAPAETPFPAPTSEVFVGDTATVGWDRVAGSGETDWMSAEETVTVFDRSAELGHPGGYLLIHLHLQNLIDETYPVRIYHYADVDVVGGDNDSGALIERTPNHLIEVVDGANLVHYVGAQEGYFPVSGIHHEAQVFALLLDDLNDSSPDPFTDTGLPMLGDVTTAYEFDFQVAPFGEEGDSFDVVVLLGVNQTLNCSFFHGVFCDGFEGGSPGLWITP